MKHYPFILVLLIASLTVKATDPVAGKIYFSNQPMTSSTGSRSSFNSGENIYARLELNSGTIKEAFRIKEGKGYPYIQYRVTITNSNDYTMGGSGRNYLLLKDDQKDQSSLNFDVMPEPSKATTLISATDDFTAGYGYFPLYNTIINEKLKPGKYTVKVELYSEPLNAWGSYEDREKWPTITEEFEFNFRDEDIARVISNSKEAGDFIYENAFRHTTMPDIFSHGATITDPMATNAKVLAIVKRDLPKRTILKMVIEKTGTLWSLAHDDFGLPKYRYFYPGVYVAYKIDGKCYIGKITLRQDYSGGGTFGPLHVGFTSGNDDKGIDCAKVR
ncbi:MAG TPA: hypothetical protein VMZ03_04200 [Chitinophagaceae bacterium]|nr:hypothetical protein [Chitinophagaceae bacterium]